jgi:type IV pilus assembly protein PilA
MKTTAQTTQKGFTLIELLVVIAVIGVLATIVLAAINPLEQLKRGRDAARIAAVTQVGHSWTNYVTAQAQTAYPTAAAGWQATLTSANELSQVISIASGGVTCGAAVNQQSGVTGGNLCYATYTVSGNANAGAVIWTTLESQNAVSKAVANGQAACPSPANAEAFVYDTGQGKAGYQCLAVTTGVAATPTGGATLY